MKCSMMKPEFRCEKCYFWVVNLGPREPEDEGICHRYPQRIAKLREDWCGEWKPKAEQPQGEPVADEEIDARLKEEIESLGGEVRDVLKDINRLTDRLS